MAIDVRLTGMTGSDVEAMLRMYNALRTDLVTIQAQHVDLATSVATFQAVIASARYRAMGNPAFAIKSNFDVQNANAISYTNGGTLKTLAAAQTFDTGTAATIATAKWGVAVLTVNSSGTPVVTWFTNAGVGYADEATAIAAITAWAATDTPLGYVTVLAAGSTWTAGTDALQGGTGGTPATTTTYYNNIDPNGLVLGLVTSGGASFDTIDASSVLLGSDTISVNGSTYTG